MYVINKDQLPTSFRTESFHNGNVIVPPLWTKNYDLAPVRHVAIRTIDGVDSTIERIRHGHTGKGTYTYFLIVLHD